MEIAWGVFLLFVIKVLAAKATTTADRIRANGYPAETHTVQTIDGYILTMFRIPHPSNSSSGLRPIAFLNHGMISSSDTFILNGPGIALAYVLFDAGYDVWLSNSRGNTYCRKHVQYSPSSTEFWSFGWHEIGVYDTPVMIDYILEQTNQNSLHFVGYSQGTTVFFVLASMLPEYNKKIKSAHMISPIAFMSHMKGPLVKLCSTLVGQPNALGQYLSSWETLSKSPLRTFGCTLSSHTQWICSKVLFALWFGNGLNSFNMTLFPEFMRTHPAGSSVRQFIHYLQIHVSHKFRQFDYGQIKNNLIYGRDIPPDYNLKKITAPTFIYHAVSDYYSAWLDVEKLIKKLPNVRSTHRISDPYWNHLDFLWGNNAKQIIVDRVVKNLNKMERMVAFA